MCPDREFRGAAVMYWEMSWYLAMMALEGLNSWATKLNDAAPRRLKG